MAQTRSSRMGCPTCGCTAHIRTSRALSNKSREMYFQCLNPECEEVFKGVLEVVAIVGESKLPKEARLGDLLRPADRRKEPDPNQTDMFEQSTPPPMAATG